MNSAYKSYYGWTMQKATIAIQDDDVGHLSVQSPKSTYFRPKLSCIFCTVHRLKPQAFSKIAWKKNECRLCDVKKDLSGTRITALASL